MLISGNKKINETEIFNSTRTNSKQTFLNFFIDRYEEAYKLQLYDLIMLHKKKISPRSTYSDGLSALQIANAAYKSLKLKKVIKLK